MVDEHEIINNIYKIDTEDNEIFISDINDIILAENIVHKWYIKLNSIGITSILNNDILSNTIILNKDTIKYLKYIRNGFKPDDNINTYIKKYNITKENKINFGGYISPYNIIENIYKSENKINNFVFRKNVINYYTNPPYNKNFPLNPPSHINIINIINMSLKDNYIYIGLIASFEGIYIYHLYPEFFKQIQGKDLLNIDKYFSNLKKLLGYSKEIKKTNNKNNKSFNKHKERKIIEYHKQVITIEQFMETLKNMGIYINLHSYEEEQIPVPINIIQDEYGKYVIN